MTELESKVNLGLHLGAGASDGYILEAQTVLDGTLEQSVQTTLDNLADTISSLETNVESDINTSIQKLAESSIASVEYDSDNKQIIFKNSDGDTLTTLDATDFIKDGMVSEVSYDSDTAILTITFNTDAGKDDIEVDMSSLIDIYTAGDGITIEDNEISVDYPLSETEYNWIAEQLFDELFTVSISSSSDNSNGHWFEGESYTVTFTLTCKYDGTLVDPTSISSSSTWTQTSTGTYTTTKTVTSSSSSVSTGTTTCYYSIGSKSTSGSWTSYKHSYIYLSTDEEFDTSLTIEQIEADENTITMNSSNNSISGDYTITITETGQYVYFIIASTCSLSSVTQLGLNYLQDGYTSFTDDSYGTYKVYRSSVSMSEGSQDITVS